MMKARQRHQMAVVGKKMFFIGGQEENFEVFDSESDKFALVRIPEEYLEHLVYPTGVVSHGYMFVVFGNEKEVVLWFDAEQNEWSHEGLEILKNLSGFGCTKVPRLL